MGRPTDKKPKEAVDRRKRSAKRAPASAAAAKLAPAGAKIVGAFEEAIALMRTGEPLERHFTVRSYKVEFTPRAYGPDDVRRVRGLLGMSQVLFARFLGVDANTVRSWEQGTRPPNPIARRFMDEIEGDPEYWRRRILQNATGVGTKAASP
jgi:DNA-binding transcriptional regulator YiaG